MEYQVRFVEDEALPAGTDWAATRVHDESMFLFVKTSRISPQVMTQAWAGVRLLREARAHRSAA